MLIRIACAALVASLTIAAPIANATEATAGNFVPSVASSHTTQRPGLPPDRHGSLRPLHRETSQPAMLLAVLGLVGFLVVRRAHQ